MCGGEEVSVVWVPGLDHAGIAAQVAVERAQAPLTRHDLGRTEFLQRMWSWKEDHGNLINTQLKRLGLSLDWSRAFFTLSKEHNKGVNEAFRRLWQKGLIYNQMSMISWCPALQSAISDIEVDTVVIDSPTSMQLPGYKEPVEFGFNDLFYYPIADSNECIPVSTTRLETMLGDVALLVHADDARYGHLVGREVVHPLDPLGRRLPIVHANSDAVRMDEGSGVVKLTPAHSHVDLQAARELHLFTRCPSALKPTIGPNAHILTPGPFQNLPRYEAREKIRSALKEKGLFKERRPIDSPMAIPVCSRTGDVIEPMLRRQWFIDTKKMASNALNAVKKGDLILHPKHYEGSWREFLRSEKQRDWCVSRQLWWGHRIPAYRRKCDDDQSESPMAGEEYEQKWVVANSIAEAVEEFKSHHGISLTIDDIVQDEDVLDTWFSSGLIPSTAFGWPDTKSDDFIQGFPLEFLETGQDILFFWVARMVMLNQELHGVIPFKHVYLHGLVMDSKGKKMSKSKGNVIDPITLISGSKQKDGYGADATRFGLLLLASDQYTVSFSEENIQQARKFCNKIWQSFKFLRHNMGPLHMNYDLENEWRSISDRQLDEVDRWIVIRLKKLIALTHRTLDVQNNPMAEPKMHILAKELRLFWIEDLCSVYLESVKKRNEIEDSAEGFDVLRLCMFTALRLIHPFMPYITECIWLGHSDATRGEVSHKQPLAIQRMPSIDWLNDVLGKHPSEVCEEKVKLSLKLASLINHTGQMMHLSKRHAYVELPTSIASGDVQPLVSQALTYLPWLTSAQNATEASGASATPCCIMVAHPEERESEIAFKLSFTDEFVNTNLQKSLDSLQSRIKSISKRLSKIEKNSQKALELEQQLAFIRHLEESMETLKQKNIKINS